MKYLIACFSFLLFSILQMDAQRREFHPTVDVGINGGIGLSKIGIDKEFNRAGKMKQFNFNVMSNTGYTRHLFEIEFANRLNNEEFVSNAPNQIITFKPSIFSINYTFGYELFAYYPACMIRNQFLLGLRINAEYLFENKAIEQPPSIGNNFFITDDYGHYSADLSIVTDYHLNKKNYVVLQIYSPIATFINKNANALYNEVADPTLRDRLDEEGSWFFNNTELVWPNQHSKLGVVASYRLLLSDFVAVQVKYHGKLNSKTHYPDNPILSFPQTLYQNHHQFMVGIVGHFKGMPIGF